MKIMKMKSEDTTFTVFTTLCPQPFYLLVLYTNGYSSLHTSKINDTELFSLLNEDTC